MQVVILCGGKGTRLGASSDSIPKPLALVNGKPIIWHIIKWYMSFGINDFILPLGFGGDKIKEYFYNYEWKNFNFVKNGDDICLLQKSENWKIIFLDTGLETMTGGRIKKIQNYIDENLFMLTYGDGLADVNIKQLLDFHNDMGKVATVTGIERKSQYGILTLKNNIAAAFEEKSRLDGIINGGFFVLSNKIFDYIESDDNCIFEQKPLRALIKDEQLAVYLHKGYWIGIDTNKDLLNANETWRPSGI